MRYRRNIFRQKMVFISRWRIAECNTVNLFRFGLTIYFYTARQLCRIIWKIKKKRENGRIYILFRFLSKCEALCSFQLRLALDTAASSKSSGISLLRRTILYVYIYIFFFIYCVIQKARALRTFTHM